MEMSYRTYITDQIMLYGQNKQISKRWADAVLGEQDTRSADEIVDYIVGKLGGEK
jgi:hypothetical protein